MITMCKQTMDQSDWRSGYGEYQPHQPGLAFHTSAGSPHLACMLKLDSSSLDTPALVSSCPIREASDDTAFASVPNPTAELIFANRSHDARATAPNPVCDIVLHEAGGLPALISSCPLLSEMETAPRTLADLDPTTPAVMFETFDDEADAVVASCILSYDGNLNSLVSTCPLIEMLPCGSDGPNLPVSNELITLWPGMAWGPSAGPFTSIRCQAIGQQGCTVDFAAPTHVSTFDVNGFYGDGHPLGCSVVSFAATDRYGVQVWHENVTTGDGATTWFRNTEGKWLTVIVDQAVVSLTVTSQAPAACYPVLRRIMHYARLCPPPPPMPPPLAPPPAPPPSAPCGAASAEEIPLDTLSLSKFSLGQYSYCSTAPTLNCPFGHPSNARITFAEPTFLASFEALGYYACGLAGPVMNELSIVGLDSNDMVVATVEDIDLSSTSWPRAPDPNSEGVWVTVEVNKIVSAIMITRQSPSNSYPSFRKLLTHTSSCPPAPPTLPSPPTPTGPPCGMAGAVEIPRDAIDTSSGMGPGAHQTIQCGNGHPSNCRATFFQGPVFLASVEMNRYYQAGFSISSNYISFVGLDAGGSIVFTADRIDVRDTKWDSGTAGVWITVQVQTTVSAIKLTYQEPTNSYVSFRNFITYGAICPPAPPAIPPVPSPPPLPPKPESPPAPCGAATATDILQDFLDAGANKYSEYFNCGRTGTSFSVHDGCQMFLTSGQYIASMELNGNFNKGAPHSTCSRVSLEVTDSANGRHNFNNIQTGSTTWPSSGEAIWTKVDIDLVVKRIRISAKSPSACYPAMRRTLTYTSQCPPPPAPPSPPFVANPYYDASLWRVYGERIIQCGSSYGTWWYPNQQGYPDNTLTSCLQSGVQNGWKYMGFQPGSKPGSASLNGYDRSVDGACKYYTGSTCVLGPVLGYPIEGCDGTYGSCLRYSTFYMFEYIGS